MNRPPSDRIAPPSAPSRVWNAWLDSQPARELPHPWPFPVSATGDGMVRNVQPAVEAVAKKPRGKPPGSLVKLRVAFGEVPPAGAVLTLASGRRYFVSMTGPSRTIHCRVLDPDAPLPSTTTVVLPWVWASRRGVLERKAA